jgi:hypothetical protein
MNYPASFESAKDQYDRQQRDNCPSKGTYCAGSKNNLVGFPVRVAFLPVEQWMSEAFIPHEAPPD